MITTDRLGRDLVDWFAESVPPDMPDDLDRILQLTAVSRQRPSWSFPERWLPMGAIRVFRATTTGVPWRAVALLAVLLLGFIVGALLVGARRDRGPAPAFGLASNGVLAYSGEGDIYTVDPTNGQPRLLISGPETDLDPQWSRDGSRFVFQRLTDHGARAFLVVANADGTSPVVITPSPILVDPQQRSTYSFSPDGRNVLYLSAGQPWVAASDGTGVSRVGNLNALTEVAFRPPHGRQIAFVVAESIGIADVDGSNGEILVWATPNVATGAIQWSPDGSMLAYNQWDSSVVDRFKAHAMALRIDTREAGRLDPMADSIWDGLPVWSNDGSRVVLTRGYSAHFGDIAAAILPVDGGPVVTTARGILPDEECCAAIEWAPDDASILWRPLNASYEPQPQLLLDPTTGAITSAPWGATSDPAIQRRAP